MNARIAGAECTFHVPQLCRKFWIDANGMRRRVDADTEIILIKATDEFRQAPRLRKGAGETRLFFSAPRLCVEQFR